MEVWCAYCLDEYRKEKRVDVGRKIRGQELSGVMHEVWLYERPSDDILTERESASHGICPFHYKKELIKSEPQ